MVAVRCGHENYDDILADVSVVGLSLSVWPSVLVGGELGPVRGTFSIPRCPLYRLPILFALLMLLLFIHPSFPPSCLSCFVYAVQ